MIFPTIYDNICCCLRLKSKQIIKFSLKRGFNGCSGVIGYVDSNTILSTTFDQFFGLFFYQQKEKYYIFVETWFQWLLIVTLPLYENKQLPKFVKS